MNSDVSNNIFLKVISEPNKDLKINMFEGLSDLQALIVKEIVFKAYQTKPLGFFKVYL